MSVEDELWYKDAIIYEVHVRAFHDSLGAGRGDFIGLTQKLDYLRDLGVTAIWLLPFYPSPLKDDGYDIADYSDVHRDYGRLDDFREFLEAAHRRDIRVITELVINHTSDKHPWFQRARHAPPGSPERDFYVWSDTPEKFRQARVIFQDFETSNWTWDPVAKAYFWHRFYSHQPDLNYDNPAVWGAIFPLVDFWLGMGVDGMRLDAVPYLFEREGTNCENLPETHAFLKALRAHIDSNFPNRMVLAEANQWPEDAVDYFGSGDECHVAFHFPLMPRLFMSLHQEDRFPILDILAQTPTIPDNCQWCLFLRNHDELTLEMVTDEERDYMYRAYAHDPQARINLGIRHRLAPLLSNDRRRIELMNALLFSLPGCPVLYYGDEIGMGDNIYLGDRNGVRTPMQWSSDRNAGFSRANPQKLYLPVIIDPEYHFEAVNVEAQQNNPSSLLWWMKRLIALRKQYRAFSRGTIEFFKPDNAKIFAFVRRYQDEVVLVVTNLSRFVQHAELDLREFRGLVPEELFGKSRFPPIGDQPYLLTIGPHGFYWFSLEQPQPGQRGDPGQLPRNELETINVPDRWEQWLFREEPDRLEALLPSFLQQRRSGSRSEILSAKIQHVIPGENPELALHWLLLQVDDGTETAKTVLLPLALINEDAIPRLLEPISKSGLVRLSGSRTGVLCDALAVPECGQALIAAIRAGSTRWLADGVLAAVPMGRLTELSTAALSTAPITLTHSERFNAALTFDSQLVLKTYWSVEEGMNPDLEISTFLSRQPDFDAIAPLMGYIEFRKRNGRSLTLAVLHQYVDNQGSAWQLTLDHLSLFYERVAALSKEQSPDFSPSRDPRSPEAAEVLEHLIGGFIPTVKLLGERTAALHRALASDTSLSAFAPEPFSRHYQRSLYQSMRNLTYQVCTQLVRERSEFSPEVDEAAQRVLALQDTLLRRFRKVVERPLSGSRIRCHGDYHLAQLLSTGNDFIVIDFEGDPEQTIGERQVKRSPFQDVASMLCSFDNAAHVVLLDLVHRRGRAPGVIRPEDRATLEPWATLWLDRVSREFVASYVGQIEPTGLLPATAEDRETLLEIYLLQQALDEIGRAVTLRPEWLIVMLHRLLREIGETPPEDA